MGLDRITLANFRNHQATRLDGTAQFNLLVGENGAGKTNVLERYRCSPPAEGCAVPPCPKFRPNWAMAALPSARCWTRP